MADGDEVRTCSVSNINIMEDNIDVINPKCKEGENAQIDGNSFSNSPSPFLEIKQHFQNP